MNYVHLDNIFKLDRVDRHKKKKTLKMKNTHLRPVWFPEFYTTVIFSLLDDNYLVRANS
jgi:hypothetical protein